MVRGKLRGIFESAQMFRVRVRFGPSTPLTSGTLSSTIGNDIFVVTFPLVPGGADTNKNRPTEAANNLIKRVKRVVLDFRRFRNDRARPALPGQAQLGSTRRDCTQLPFDIPVWASNQECKI
jgi:hypothetical protein